MKCIFCRTYLSGRVYEVTESRGGRVGVFVCERRNPSLSLPART